MAVLVASRRVLGADRLIEFVAERNRRHRTEIVAPADVTGFVH